MKIYSFLFIISGLILGNLIILPKIKIKSKNYIIIYIIFILFSSVLINLYEHAFILTKLELQKMIFIIITAPVLALLIKTKISISNLWTIIFIFDLIYNYISGQIEYLNTNILCLIIILIYKLIKFYKNKKSNIT
ncbi:MAG: hypothetical protein J6C55_04345 [Oscillospiraceae bacterium]|nr:hypothetical protein [Oscillospiraceae bacterium]